MFLPIRTDRPLRHRPWVNYHLIGLNVAIFLLQSGDASAPGQEWFRPLMLFPGDPQWYQFISYQFLHGGWLHLGGNMLFLFVFGNNLEDRFGPVGYLCFYLAGGIIAGVGHCLTSDAFVLGASGSVSAVTGAYLALFPLTQVLVLFVFFIITFFNIPSMYIILFSFGWDLLQHFMGGGRVAYLAHISGNIFGFAIGMGLLAARILPREGYDMLALLDRWNRRRQFRAATRRGGAPWEGEAGRAAEATAPLDPHQERIMRVRADISEALERHDSQAALEAYERLLELDGEQVLHRRGQLDLGNFAMHAGHHETAARAYEGFLRQHPRDPSADEVRLMLGLVYHRYLGRPEDAKAHLAAAVDQLGDPDRQELARRMLAEIG